jgi:putative FmdB family regulatory protein
MPIYEYICDDCQTRFEKIVFNKTQEIACPQCAGKNGNGSPKSQSASSGGGGGCCGGGCGCH